MDFLAWLEIVGGVCTTAAAEERLTVPQLRRLRSRGVLWSPLRGWVALAGLDNSVTRALEHGGVATCVSAFRSHGLWVPHGDEQLHVRVNRETHSERVETAAEREGVRVHRMRTRLPDDRPWDGIDSIPAALAVATECISTLDVLAAAESALWSGKLRRSALHELAERLPTRRRRCLQQAGERSGSGSESMFAAMLRGCGIAFVQQPELLPQEFFDFLIGKSLVVEIDSVEWHGSRAQQAADRRRDAQLTSLGYRVVRFTYEQVLFDPEYVRATILGLVRRNVHQRELWPRSA